MLKKANRNEEENNLWEEGKMKENVRINRNSAVHRSIRVQLINYIHEIKY